MAIRKRKKHHVEVNMSSMTDIIFMLLIFFMLTSTMVKFIQYKLPESSQRTTSTIKTIVGIEKDKKTGNFIYAVNYKKVPFNQLEGTLKATIGVLPEGNMPTVTIAAEQGVTFDQITRIMAIANRLKARTILATDPVE